MAIQHERLQSIIEFAQQSARLAAKPAATVAQHGEFRLFENEVQGRPGLRFNENHEGMERELWLVVERLHETPPPPCQQDLLKPWLDLPQGPESTPSLKASAPGSQVSEAERLVSQSGTVPSDVFPASSSAVMLDDYFRKEDVRAAFQRYVDSKWKPWADEEKGRRETIRLYSKLFTLRQQLEGGLVEAPSELVWGVGVGIWNCSDTFVQYPLLTRAVEILLNQENSSIEIVPRDVEPRLETDWYASVDNPGLATLEKQSKEFFAKATTTFSPFDKGTFEPLLRVAVTHLDSNGEYWPDHIPAGNRSLPAVEKRLRVTDTWVLFARPRLNNLFVLDLENFKTALVESKGDIQLPRAVHQVVSEPSSINPEVTFPVFRGLSGSTGDSSSNAMDLYFPKAFNDEQVRILQLLEVSDGVVVQGPPGTGKTHSIANVICHYLASGKRVLVTSMKEPALAVLRESLPIDIQPLAISLLTSEFEGMKQFEHAIHRIASEVQSLDRTATRKEITHLGENIDGLHATLSRVDREIEKWAMVNLAPICIDGERLNPHDAAKLTVEARELYSWLKDELSIDARHQPRFGQEEILRLRDARRVLGRDIDYLNMDLPEICDFPAPEAILQSHRDLTRLAELEAEVKSGSVPELGKSGDEFVADADKLLVSIREMRRLLSRIKASGYAWAENLRRYILSGEAVEATLGLLGNLGNELKSAVEKRQTYLSRPISIPAVVFQQPELLLAITNLAEGKKAFGGFGFLGKSEQKRHIESITVVGLAPRGPEDWKHILGYIRLHQHFQQLAIRWNALACELHIDTVKGASSNDGLDAAKMYEIVEMVKTSVELENRIRRSAQELVPSRQLRTDCAITEASLGAIEYVIQHHLAKQRLSHVWGVKQAMLQRLEMKTGQVSERLRGFVSHSLGNPSIGDSDLQRSWSELMRELGRIHGLRSFLVTVAEVTERIASSGAPLWSDALRQPITGAIDALLPDNWQLAWKYRRIATHLAAIDQQHLLYKLSSQRKAIESQLASAYKDVVVKQTWLKLADNASPRIRNALQAYLNAIQKIGKGTGKRAVRYRQDAKQAAAEANPAVPCWIMPHYRVSETIPCEFGCFDLVIVDEASQSDLTALPALLRAEKVLIVGDDKQVSPEGIGLEEEKVRSLMQRFLSNQVPVVRAQLSPERSIYDLFKVVFASSTVMLKEHFRCVASIIEYSKREFYNHELRPLRRPRLSERLDPPLIDVFVEDGYRNGDVNRPEGRFIVDEIKRLLADANFGSRSIGVVSLLGEKQALDIWQRLTEEIGLDAMERHRIACGDARTFQGKERSVMFLSMVSAPNEVRIAPLVREGFSQRFNVAASRAQDRMYLVRSVDAEHLSEADRLRRGLIAHFVSPFMRDEVKVEDLRKLCESPFEADVYDCLSERGYSVTPQVRFGPYRIDMVVEGANDARLAIECDGDRYHGPEKWMDDTHRQRVLERAGWIFWRCFASAWIRRKDELVQELLTNIQALGIQPCTSESLARSIYTETRRVTATPINV